MLFIYFFCPDQLQLASMNGHSGNFATTCPYNPKRKRLVPVRNDLLHSDKTPFAHL